ncbi:MerR family transcriptional regulator [Rhodomicrobium vannielii]|uniref:MerR family transcriptional regulator n=1 Tax=Rhodomicrobium vannielii TaxID=1069 RepID=UPI000B4B6D64|nr:MerR family transcriptional regulator [Rhodomicrobium vannielii]
MLIGEVAKKSGLSKDGIRHYEQLGLISSVPRQAGSKIYRDYDPSVLETIDQIRGSQHFLRLSLKEIGPLLKTIAETPPTDAQRLEYLEERLAVVRKQISTLREVEDHISEKVERLKVELGKSSTQDSAPVAGSANCEPNSSRRRRSPQRQVGGLAR